MSSICLTFDVARLRTGKDEDLTIFGRKVVDRLKALKKNRNWLAGELGINKQTLANWLKQEDIHPQIPDAWGKMSRLLEVDEKRLRDDRLGLQPKQIERGLPVIVPEAVLGLFRLPIPEMEVELPRWPALPCDENWEYQTHELEETYPVPVIFARSGIHAPQRIVAPVRGKSMEPRLREGDWVVIELDTTPRTGRIVLAQSDKGKTLKVLMRNHDGGVRLDPINPKHGEAKAELWAQEGVVIGILRDYNRGRGFIEWDFGGIGP